VLALSLGAIASPAAAQEEQQTQDDKFSSQSGAESPQAAEPAGTDEAADVSDKPAANAVRNWSFGPYFRFVIVPAFMLKLFLDEAPTPANVGFGASATYRSSSGSPSFDMGIGYTGYGFTGPFRTKGGDENDTELVKSNLGFVHLTGSVLWESDFAEDKLAVQYGFGLDLGIVTGKLMRSEAYRTPTGGWAACIGPGVPNPAYCQAPLTAAGIAAGTDPYNVKGEQYNVQEKSIPPVMAFPMLPRLGLRYTPIPDFWVRLDAAYGIAQFWFGLSAAYVPKM
jgi:hypothetical protein